MLEKAATHDMFGLVIQHLDDAIAMADGDDVPSIVNTHKEEKA